MAGPTAQGLLAAQKQKQQASQPGLLSGLSLSPVGPDGLRVPPMLQGILDSAISGATFPGDVYAGRADPTDYGRALDTAGMVTLGAAAFPANPNELRMGISLKHASPHDFDKFERSAKTRGTGEGKQVYGDGIYFSESDDVVNQYSKFFKDKTGKSTRYEVDVNAEPGDFIDLHKPISSQSEKVKKAILGKDGVAHFLKSDPSIAEAMKYTPINDIEKMTGEQFYALLDRLAQKGVLPSNGPGVVGESSATAASNFLMNEGVTGLTQGISKSAKNYIVFDPETISIVKKYGIIGALSMGAITMQQASQLANEQKRFSEALASGKGA